MLTWEKLRVWITICGYVCIVNYSKIQLCVPFAALLLNRIFAVVKIPLKQTDFYNLS